ncbi:MAG: hypothetical protein ACK5AY_11085 [Bacteroidota bacterium]|jgi:DNA-binding transcriptional ArsR family regulator
MQTENRRNWVNWSNQMVLALRKSADEIEKFSLQAKLGIMEFRDLLERTRNEIKISISNISSDIKTLKFLPEEQRKKIIESLSELRDQLAPLTAGTINFFSVQYLKITNSLTKLKKLIANIQLPERYKNLLEIEIRKFQIKLSILRLKYESNRLKTARKLKRRRFKSGYSLIST